MTTTAQILNLPVKSAEFFEDLANDAGNWSGNPYFDGNVAAGRSAAGMVRKLVEVGLIESGDDDGHAFAIFTDKGVEAAAKIGIDLNWINDTTYTVAQEPRTVAVIAEAEVEPAKTTYAVRAFGANDDIIRLTGRLTDTNLDTPDYKIFDASADAIAFADKVTAGQYQDDDGIWRRRAVKRTQVLQVGADGTFDGTVFNHTR